MRVLLEKMNRDEAAQGYEPSRKLVHPYPFAKENRPTDFERDRRATLSFPREAEVERALARWRRATL